MHACKHCTHTHTHARTNARTCTSTCAHPHVHTPTHTYTLTHIYTHTQTHTHMRSGTATAMRHAGHLHTPPHRHRHTHTHRHTALHLSDDANYSTCMPTRCSRAQRLASTRSLAQTARLHTRQDCPFANLLSQTVAHVIFGHSLTFFKENMPKGSPVDTAPSSPNSRRDDR